MPCFIKHSLALTLLTLLITLAACDSSEPEGDDPGLPPEDIVLSDEAEVLDGGDEDEVEAVSDDGRTLAAGAHRLTLHGAGLPPESTSSGPRARRTPPAAGSRWCAEQALQTCNARDATCCVTTSRR